MSRTRLFRLALLGTLALALPGLPACSSDDTPPSTATTADVQQEGEATQHQLDAFLAFEPEDWAWAGGQFDTPEDQAVLPQQVPFEFSWHADSTEPSEAGASGTTQMVHLLVFSTAKQKSVLRVFTTLGSYTPDERSWKKLTLAGEPITVSLSSGTFEGDTLTVDGGPYVGQTLTFTVE